MRLNILPTIAPFRQSSSGVLCTSRGQNWWTSSFRVFCQQCDSWATCHQIVQTWSRRPRGRFRWCRARWDIRFSSRSEHRELQSYKSVRKDLVAWRRKGKLSISTQFIHLSLSSPYASLYNGSPLLCDALRCGGKVACPRSSGELEWSNSECPGRGWKNRRTSLSISQAQGRRRSSPRKHQSSYCLSSIGRRRKRRSCRWIRLGLASKSLRHQHSPAVSANRSKAFRNCLVH